MAKAIAFLVLLLISPAVYAATTHIVGGDKGWTTGFNYSNWASERTFTIGDTLLFNYDDDTHAVYEVREDYYIDCENDDFSDEESDDEDDYSHDNDRISAQYTSSPTSILLSTAGTRYFICPMSDHCARGLKLAVTVMAGSTSNSGNAPSPSTAPSPTLSAPPLSEDGASATVDIVGGNNGLPDDVLLEALRNATIEELTVGGNNGLTKLLKFFESSTDLSIRWSYVMQQFYILTAVEPFVINFIFDEVTHAVYEVSQGDYNGCINESPINVYTSSPASIVMSTVGTRYFIDPRSNNCKLGLKSAVTVKYYRSGVFSVTVKNRNTTAGGTAPSPSSTNAGSPSPTS